jgi:hypothetical protein
MIKDDNTLEDILGAIYSAQMDLASPEPEFSPKEQIEDIIERIEDKLRRNSNSVRENWFQEVISFAQKALSSCEDNPKAADTHLKRCEEYLRDGINAHKRKVDFIVGPNGTEKYG